MSRSSSFVGFAFATAPLQRKMVRKEAVFDPGPQRAEKRMVADARRARADSSSGREFVARDPITFLSDRNESVDDREPALFQFCDAQDERLAQIIAERLDHPFEDERFKAVLVVAAERLRVHDESNRRTLRDALGRYWLRALPSDGPTVWAAIRRFASLLNDDEAFALAHALDTSNPTGVQQVAIQSLTSFFTRPNLGARTATSVAEPVRRVGLHALGRSRALAGEVRAEWIALASSVVVLLAATGAAEAEPLARELAASVGGVVRRQLKDDVRGVANTHRLHLATSAHARDALASAEAIAQVFEG